MQNKVVLIMDMQKVASAEAKVGQEVAMQEERLQEILQNHASMKAKIQEEAKKGNQDAIRHLGIIHQVERERAEYKATKGI